MFEDNVAMALKLPQFEGVSEAEFNAFWTGAEAMLENFGAYLQVRGIDRTGVIKDESYLYELLAKLMGGLHSVIEEQTLPKVLTTYKTKCLNELALTLIRVEAIDAEKNKEIQ